jgi:hypothetical protein
MAISRQNEKQNSSRGGPYQLGLSSSRLPALIRFRGISNIPAQHAQPLFTAPPT